MSDTKHDVNAYSPEGRLYQLEYAMKASELGTTTIGICTSSFVLLISEKKTVNPLQKIETIKKHFKVNDNVVFGFSGIAGDARSIVERARDECMEHLMIYNEKISGEALLKYLCSLSLKFGEKDAERKIFSRPFGVSMLVGIYDTEPRLYVFDPSGSYRRYKAKALGAAVQGIELELKNFDLSREKEEVIKEGLKIMREVMRESIGKNNVEVAVVDVGGVLLLDEREIEKYLIC